MFLEDSNKHFGKVQWESSCWKEEEEGGEQQQQEEQQIHGEENAENKNQAKVTQYQGLYLFVDCEPINKTKYLGTIKSKMSFSSSQYSSLRDKMIKKCKKDFPDAEGLILKFVSGGTDTGDAIKFDE
jgi:hypothetical protein